MKFALAALALFMLQAAPATPTYAQAPKPENEEDVKAQIILNLPLVASWPESSLPQDGKMRLCALRQGSVGASVQKMLSQDSSAEHIIYTPGVPFAQLGECQLLLLDTQSDAEIKQALSAIHGKPVLTIGTAKDFVRRGGMIGFLSTQKNIGLFSQKNVKFEVNLKETAEAGIALDPLLLELAEKIIPENAP